MKRSLLAFFGSILLLVLFLVLLGPVALFEQLVSLNLWIFSLGLIAIMLSLIAWSEAFRTLFRLSGSMTVRQALLAYCTGVFGKQILPMGHAGGPAIMAYTFERHVSLNYNQTLAVVSVAEFLNLVASLVLAIGGIAYLLLFASPIPELQLLQVGILVFTMAIVGLGILVWYRRRTVERSILAVAYLLRHSLGRVSVRVKRALGAERIQSSLHGFYTALDRVFENRSAILLTFIYMQIGWIFFTVPLFTGALSLGIQLPIALVLFLVPASGVATIIPLPGGLGGFELLLAGILVALTGHPVTTVAAIVIVYRLCSYWFMVLVGGIASAVSAIGITGIPSELARTGE